MDSLKSAASSVGSYLPGSGASGGEKNEAATKSWNAMSEDQKKQTFDALPSEKKQGKSYTEWIKEGYQHQYENWMPWIEDLYLRWFTSDNKASYATKDALDKSKITGVEQVDKLQDGVNDLVAGQVGQGGLLQPVGDLASKEGLNRAERGGKDDSGQYTPAGVGDGMVADKPKEGGQGVLGAGQSAVGGAGEYAKGAGGYVGGLMGGKKDEAK